MQQFESRLTDIDKFNENERWMQLFNGIFAGNIFDWGALAVTQILECDKNFGLNEAMKRIQPRPWLIDGFDGWMKRIEVSFIFKRWQCMHVIRLNDKKFNFYLGTAT